MNGWEPDALVKNMESAVFDEGHDAVLTFVV